MPVAGAIIIRKARLWVSQLFGGPGRPTLANPFYRLQQIGSGLPNTQPFNVRFEWQAPTHFGRGATAITGYECEYESFVTAGHSGWISLGTVTTLAATVQNVPVGNFVRFRVRAVNNAASPKKSRWLTMPTVRAYISQNRQRVLDRRPRALSHDIITTLVTNQSASITPPASTNLSQITPVSPAFDLNAADNQDGLSEIEWQMDCGSAIVYIADYNFGANTYRQTRRITGTAEVTLADIRADTSATRLFRQNIEAHTGAPLAAANIDDVDGVGQVELFVVQNSAGNLAIRIFYTRLTSGLPASNNEISATFTIRRRRPGTGRPRELGA